MRIPLYRRAFDPLELEAIERVMRSGWLTRGKETELFEAELLSHFNRSTLLVSSCTAALHLAVVLTGIRAGDEVITTPLTFRATRNAILYAGGIPVYVDVKDDGCIDENLIERAITYKTKAVISVSYAGNGCNHQAIHRITQKYGLKYIQDNAHAVENEFEYGDYGCYSFYCTKNLSIGEGGALVLPAEQYHYAFNLHRHGDITPLITLGYKYNFTDLQAAIGRVQLANLNENSARRIEAIMYYQSKLNNVRVVTEHTGGCHLCVVEALNPAQIRNTLNTQGIETSFHYPLLADLPNVKRLSSGLFTLPLYPDITVEELDIIIDAVNEVTYDE